MTLEELFMQGMGLLPALQQKEDMIKQLKELVATKKEELKLYTDQLAALQASEKELLGGIKDALESKGIDSLKVGKFKITVVAGREAIDVDESVEPDPKFVEMVKKFKKKEAMDYYKASKTGTLPKGFKIKTGKSYLKITEKKVEDEES